MKSRHLALLVSLLGGGPIAASHPSPPDYDLRLLAELRTHSVEHGIELQSQLRIYRGGATQTESRTAPVGETCGFREVGLVEASTAAIRDLELELAGLDIGRQRGGCGLARDPRPVHIVTWVGWRGRRTNTFAVGADYLVDCPAPVRAIIAELQDFDKMVFGPDHRATFAGPTCLPSD